MSRLLISSSSRISQISGLNAARKFCSSEELSKTAFYDLHNELGGKMVSFAGYSLPVQVRKFRDIQDIKGVERFDFETDLNCLMM